MATYTSTATGLWSAGSTWVGGVKPPSAGGHKVVIATGHVVTFDEAAGTYGDDSTTGITVNGTLKASRTTSTALTCRGDLYIGIAGTLDYGTEADPIPASYTADIILNDSATMASNKYGIRTEEASNDWSGFRMWGASKTAMTTIPAGAASGDTTFTVADATNWNVGDWLAFEPSVAQDVVNGTVWRAITGKSGNDITVGADLGYASQVGRRVFNLSRNVRVWGKTGNTYKTHISIRPRSAFATANAVEIGPCEIRTFGGSSNTWQFGGLNLNWASTTNATAVVKKIDGPVVHDIWSISGSTTLAVVGGGSAALCGFTNQYYNYEVRNMLVSSRNNSAATQIQNGSSVTFKDLMVCGASRLVSCGYSQGCVGLVYDGGVCTGLVTEIVGSTGVSIEIKNMTFDWVNRINSSGANAFGGQQIRNCTFGSGNNKGVYLGTSSANTYALGTFVPLLVDNCVFKEWPLVIDRAGSNSQYIKPETYLQIRNANNDPAEQRAWYRWGQKVRDNATIKRGASSIRMDVWYNNLTSSASRTIAVAAGQTITVVGYLRFNAAYGTATPPVVTISGLGAIPVTYTAAATADAWHKFSLTITNPQSYAGEFTLEVVGQSTAGTTSAYCWIDGVPFADYVTTVRHYGYVFDANAYRAVDPAITVTNESTVAAYTEIETLDKLYDRLALWACENPTANVFYSYAGATLDIGSYNLVVDATAAAAFDVTGTTVTINASVLADGAKFTKVKTTGTITTLHGAVISTIYQSSAGTSAKLIIALPHASMSVDVWNATSQVQYLAGQSGTYTLLIAPGATGTWTWVVNKQGYVFGIGTFTPGVGGTFEYAPDCAQVVDSVGTPSYQGTASPLVQVSYASGTTYIDIGNGTPTLQSIYDEFEDYLVTSNGMDWLVTGHDSVSIFNSAGGDFLFMTGDIRLRRWHSGDSNATVPAFAQSVDGTPVDEVNGPVRYLTSDSPTAIAAAVMEYTVETGKTMQDMVRLMSAVLLGKSSGAPTNPVFRDVNDTKNRVSGVVDTDGNRTAVTVDAT